MVNSGFDDRSRAVAAGLVRLQDLSALLRLVQQDLRFAWGRDRADALALPDRRGGFDWRRNQFGN